MSLPRYPNYKDSGVAWLGEVPGHWEVKRLRYITSCLDGRRVPLNSEQRSEKHGDVPYWGANSIMDYVDEPLFDEDLVLLGEDGAPFFDRTRPVAFFSQGRVWPNNHVHVLRPQNPEWCKFITQVLNVTDYANFIDGSTRDKLTQGAMNSIPLPWPTDEEQQAIAAFLDLETGKIDALIAEQQRLVVLLAEKRQAVISHAVTKGLNPNARMKDSGIEWLGVVPEHWVVMRFKQIAELIDGDRSSIYPSDQDIVDEGVPFLSSKNIVGYKFADTDLRFITQEKFDSLSRGKILDGDLAITVRGTIGHVAVYDAQLLGHPTAFINAQMMIIRPNGVTSSFVHSISESHYWQKQLDVASYGTAQQQLSNSILRNIFVVVPPENERCEISKHLDNETAKFDTLTAEANRAIELLQERRNALISAAVTGKIDVRGIQVLPQ